MSAIKPIKVSGYEKVTKVNDRASHLHAIIAVHNTVLGPSLGGIRMWSYHSEKEALEDALRLAKAMTYKASISNLNLGGGKAVVIGDPKRDKTKELFLALGDFIETLKGIFIAAEDSGIKPEDVDIVAQRTRHVTGTTRHGSGDPSPTTAWGVFAGIQACCRQVFKNDDLKNFKVAVQGVGQVGFALAELLHEAGARLIVSDFSKDRAERAARNLKAEVVSPEKIHLVEADVFSPCGFGGILNPKTIGEIKAKIVAGGANNQFENEKRDSLLLAKRGILHAPDYVINAGGLIQLYVKEILQEQELTLWIEQIAATLEKIFSISRKEKKPPLLVAHRLAEERIKKKKKS